MVGIIRKQELGAGVRGQNCLCGQKGMSSKFHSNGIESTSIRAQSRGVFGWVVTACGGLSLLASAFSVQ